MIRDLIIEFSPISLLILIVVFSLIKVSAISSSINKDYFSLFFNSFLFYNKVTIRNTFHERLKGFYQKSNKINTFFYTLIALNIVAYLLMRSF